MVGLHSRLHQPADSGEPSLVAAGLAALLTTLKDADKRALARLLAAEDKPGKSPRA